jgi:hypothetical protein
VVDDNSGIFGACEWKSVLTSGNNTFPDPMDDILGYSPLWYGCALLDIPRCPLPSSTMVWQPNHDDIAGLREVIAGSNVLGRILP